MGQSSSRVGLTRGSVRVETFLKIWAGWFGSDRVSFLQGIGRSGRVSKNGPMDNSVMGRVRFVVQSIREGASAANDFHVVHSKMWP
jgi:hypothetical protein